MELLEGEKVLSDDYPVYGDYVYIADGKLILCDLLQGTVRELKQYLKVKEIRRCDIVKRGLIN